MTTIVYPGEDGQQQQPQQETIGSNDPSVPSVRDIVRVVGFLGAGLVLVAFVVAYVWGTARQAYRIVRVPSA